MVHSCFKILKSVPSSKSLTYRGHNKVKNVTLQSDIAPQKCQLQSDFVSQNYEDSQSDNESQAD